MAVQSPSPAAAASALAFDLDDPALAIQRLLKLLDRRTHPTTTCSPLEDS